MIGGVFGNVEEVFAGVLEALRPGVDRRVAHFLGREGEPALLRRQVFGAGCPERGLAGGLGAAHVVGLVFVEVIDLQAVPLGEEVGDRGLTSVGRAAEPEDVGEEGGGFGHPLQHTAGTGSAARLLSGTDYATIICLKRCSAKVLSIA